MKEIPFYKPYIDQRERSLINEVLDLEKANKVETLEKEFIKYIDCGDAISTVNGTAAMHLAMCALDLKRGDKIICSVNAFPSVAEVVRHFDAEPIFVDIDKDDFNIDVDQLESVLKNNKAKKLKGAFISHIAGQPADMNRIYELARHYDIKIVEDATAALGATYEKKKIGSLEADITVFRFNPQSNYSVSSAGIMTTKDEELSRRARLLRNHAIVSEGWDKFGNIGYVYDVVDIGLKYDLNELNAAFAIGQLEKNDDFIERRMEIADIYNRELASCPHVSTPIKKRDHVYTQYIIKIDKNRDNFARELKDKGIYTGLHFIPLHLLSYYKHKYNLRVNDFPKALSNYQQILSLPIYSSLSDKEVLHVCEQIKEIAKNRV
ncbi:MULTISPECIES: DegT/DnrJ/EryC1/StrS aminotransferase family protein [Sulfurospirillum]|jgi:dTDP-4-amino-4,6-dideoxygalactose transaminase|uniref:DegT/DnrJ/EryC1/StrS aminotransferase family protein n=1 Tax=Sulfurospirillum cavolei TaxID=366522 RepID=A0A2D3W8E0_9BACT|nr:MULTISPECIES: DegT/DnrJ/EryC1/StrS aminotransferase family protein [Sulfurospirillum]KHG34257.1 MAG: aminotransferase DegT [Sulfurospirillum sp. MES]MCP3651033.1 DegT/DnrJ/EryC1/StrS aminotransferase family protein [Sulfurospirillum sp. DNRA8]MCR1809879.1 DegT/DnrJ/EryC1/StrS aminotransferase family protein [Sulfurospirillum sp. DNRA8]MDY0264940.1 DegT/DnrJ/EryC1/StrS aminotransferase family protein [Sulfurospirillum cavolei]DAB36155.1 MAG TPA: DegT/DnrJ/EryC1/StrS aminotransferase family p